MHTYVYLVPYVYSTVKFLGVPGHFIRNGCVPEKIYLGYMYVNLFPVHAIVTAGRVGG